MTPILIVTRPEGQNAPFAAAIKDRWDGPLEVILSPLIQIVMLPAPVPDCDAVVLTSANGVAAAKALGLADGRPAWCVGDKTAAAARVAGFAPMVGPGTADALVTALVSAQPRGRLAHIRGRHARGDVAARLGAAGLTCLDVIGYDQRPHSLTPAAKSALNGKKPVVLPLFSPRTGTILSRKGPFAAPLYLIGMSAAVRDATTIPGCKPMMVAARPDRRAMEDAVISALRDLAS